jgi:flagellar hook assembly protein FlgD
MTLAVYDTAGRLVRTLASGVSGGEAATASWDGSSESGAKVASGVYLVRLAAGGRSETTKVAVLR